MLPIRLHPDGYPVVRLESEDKARWGGLTVTDYAGVTAFFFTDDEAADWPRMVVAE